MKIYDTTAKNWKPYTEDAEKTAIRNKLIAQKIPFKESVLGIFINDSDEVKIDA